MEKIKAIFNSKNKPSEEEISKLKEFFKKKENLELDIEWKEDQSIDEGFILEIGNKVFDWTKTGRYRQFEREIKSIPLANNSFISLLKTTIDDFKPSIEGEEIGKVTSIGDGVAKIEGLDSVTFGEIVIFSDGTTGLVMEIRQESTLAIIFGDDSQIFEGSSVHRSFKTAAVGVSENLLGRVVDPLGKAIDGKGDIEIDEFYPVENEAPAILDRRSVNRPLETGILSIDSMFPIGKGQRELIIGDRQTGKSSIAIDTILNQKGKNVKCIYVSIGQKASTVARLAESLRKKGAMDYTIFVCATASDSAAYQYIAPYSATAIAEYFMDRGDDVLIVYDDLSKHAVAYRTISLLLERSPGREAYPGDVFYLHSRLLERSAQMSDEKGGGSISSLPIVETQGGDISAYIPTNIISITDGQIFLESEYFFEGQRPAINVGLSVSRVGGSAQTKAIKKATKTLRLDLAQYREMEVFTQFASDLDEETRNQLTYGKGLMELLKQHNNNPKSRHEEVITLVVALEKLMTSYDINEIRPRMRDIITYIEDKSPETILKIDDLGLLDDSDIENIIKLAKENLGRE